jgi:hypothetical protein
MRAVGIAVIATFVQLACDQEEVRQALVGWQPVEWATVAAALVEDGWIRLQGVVDERQRWRWGAGRRGPMPSARSASLIVDEDLFDLQVEQVGEAEGEWEARVELPCFDCVDRLP